MGIFVLGFMYLRKKQSSHCILSEAASEKRTHTLERLGNITFQN